MVRGPTTGLAFKSSQVFRKSTWWLSVIWNKFKYQNYSNASAVTFTCCKSFGITMSSIIAVLWRFKCNRIWDFTVSIVFPRLLFDSDRYEDYSIINSCFHPCTATSIDHWVPIFYCLVNLLSRFFIHRYFSDSFQ